MTKTKTFFRAFAKLDDGTAFEGLGKTAKKAEEAAFALMKKRMKKPPKKGDVKFETVESIGPAPRTLGKKGA
jgi:hypothetical protein